MLLTGLVGLLLSLNPNGGYADELQAYELGVRDTAVFIEKAMQYPVPGPGYWAMLDVTDMPFPRVILLMRFIEAKGHTPVYAWKAGRDYIIIGSFSRQRDAESVVDELESYGIRGGFVKRMDRLGAKLFKKRLVSSAQVCKYPEYRGVAGIKKLIEHAKELAYDVGDPTFDRNVFISELELILTKLKDYESFRKRRQMGINGTGTSPLKPADSLIEKAMEWNR